MFHRKLLEILSRLPSGQRKSFRLFLESPYFTKGLRNAQMVLNLYEYVVKYEAQEQHPKLSKESVFRQFFPNQPFRENEKGPLDVLASDLFRMLRRFLAQTDWEKTGLAASEQFVLLRFFRQYGLDERFWQTAEAFRKEQRGVLLRDAQYFFNQFLLEEEVSNFMTLHNSFEDDGNLLAVHQSLDTYYSILKLENTCALDFQRFSSQIDEPVDGLLTKAVLEWAEKNAVLSIPLNQLYQSVLNLLHHPGDEQAFSAFEQMLEARKAEIPTDKLYNLMAYYRFFWARQYLKVGNEAARRGLFDVYKKHFEQGYFHIDGNILLQSLRALVMFALKLGQFEWAKKVLDEHPPQRIAGTKYPAEAYNLNLGEYYFYKKEYDEALQNLNYKAFENPNLNILADILLIKIYFETENELLDSRMRAMEQRIRRTKLSAENKERYFNFLKKLDKIIKYSWQKDSPKRVQVVEDIRTIPNIVEREWLLEKAGYKP